MQLGGSAFDRRAAMPMQGSAICSAAGARFLLCAGCRLGQVSEYPRRKRCYDVATAVGLWLMDCMYTVVVLVRPPGARDFILHVVCHVCSSLAGIRGRTHVVVLALSTCDWASTEVEICS
jgi:hypothetical protein